MSKDSNVSKSSSLLAQHHEEVFQSILQLGENLRQISIELTPAAIRRRVFKELIQDGVFKCRNLVELKIHNFIRSKELQSIIDHNPSLVTVNLMNVKGEPNDDEEIVKFSLCALKKLKNLTVIQTRTKSRLDFNLPKKSQSEQLIAEKFELDEILVKGRLSWLTIKELSAFLVDKQAMKNEV